jgi:hypothetical protein
VSCCPASPRIVVVDIEEVTVMRTVALDVHKRFAEIAVHEDGGVRRLGRIETGQLRALAESLGPEDHVVLEST